jgi:hypothetical protein
MKRGKSLTDLRVEGPIPGKKPLTLVKLCRQHQAAHRNADKSMLGGTR